MPRKTRQQTKGRSIWLTGVTINRLLTKVNQLKDKQVLLQMSEEISDAELAAIVDEVITQFCYAGAAPAPTPTIVTPPTQIPQPAVEEEEEEAEFKGECDMDFLDNL